MHTTGKIRLRYVSAGIWAVIVCFTAAVGGESIEGTVSYADSSAAPGVTVYLLGAGQPLRINNNIIMSADHIPRGYSDAAGSFSIADIDRQPRGIFARDYLDRVAYVPDPDANQPLELVLSEPASVIVTYMEADKAVKGTEISASLHAKTCGFGYTYSSVTDSEGRARFADLVPGEYRFAIRREVPQIGCGFRSVEVKGATLTVEPGEHHELTFGNEGLAFLRGKVTDDEGDPLHGVWVRLLPGEPNEVKQNACGPPPAAIWADVTERDGSYDIYDIPAGPYTLTCYRRLALNNYSRTLRHEQAVVIASAPSESASDKLEPQICDVVVDLSAFGPLAYGQSAPALTGTLLSGDSFDLAQQIGKVVVVHFYVSGGCVCPLSTPTFDRVQDQFSNADVVVVGVSLDPNLSYCEEFVARKKLRHRQLYAGPWSKSQAAKDFRVVNVPSSIIIDPAGKVAQLDLFQDVLIQFVRELLTSRTVAAKSGQALP